MIDTLFDRLSAYIPPERLRRGEMMARHTTFRIGGPADIALMAAGSMAAPSAPKGGDYSVVVLGD